MDETYTLRWLDWAASTVLNPAKTNISAIDNNELELITARINNEIDENKTSLNAARLRLLNSRKIQLLVKHYHRALWQLLETAQKHQPTFSLTNEKAEKLGRIVIGAITELLDFIEYRFGEYVQADCWVAAPQLNKARADMQKKIDSFSDWLKNTCQDEPLFFSLISDLSLTPAAGSDHRVNFGELSYKNALIDELLTLSIKYPHGTGAKRALEQLLIGANFNSSSFITYITNSLRAYAEQINSPKERVTELHRWQSDFMQFPSRNHIALDPDQESVKQTLDRWLHAEITFLEKHDLVPRLPASTRTPEPRAAEPIKIQCLFSIDQIAIFFRALDALRYIQASSLNAVFQQIAPFLSTPRKKDISWQSMRSKSYQFEESDRKQLLLVLDQLRKWIEEYELR